MKYLALIGAMILMASLTSAASQPAGNTVPDLAQLQKMTARFAPTEMNVDLSKLSDGDRKALVKLVEAARIIDDIFMTQYWSGDHSSMPNCKRIRRRSGTRVFTTSGSTKDRGRRSTTTPPSCPMFRSTSCRGRISIPKA